MTSAHQRRNIAEYLPEAARRHGEHPAVHHRGRTVSFAELERRSAAYACALRNRGVVRGMRTLLLLRPGADFIAAVFAVFRIGAVPVLIDPGMGLENFLGCVRMTGPEAMVGIARAHWLALCRREPFRCVRHRLAVGGGAPPWIPRLEREARRGKAEYPVAPTHPDDPAAIVFTTGSTGPPKGVAYTHRIFLAQTELIRDVYGAWPDQVDMPAFPLFALFSAALGMPCVIPEMDPSRPAHVDPEVIVGTILRHGVTFSFGSPALWRRVAGWCRERQVRLPTLRRVVGQTRNMAVSPEGKLFWPVLETQRMLEVLPHLRQYQFEQTAIDAITVTLVCAPAPTVEQLLRLQTVLEQALGHAYRWGWRFQETPIPLGVGGKFEEFVSLIAEPGWAPRPSRCLNQ